MARKPLIQPVSPEGALGPSPGVWTDPELNDDHLSDKSADQSPAYEGDGSDLTWSKILSNGIRFSPTARFFL